jgi:hypothetical protein
MDLADVAVALESGGISEDLEKALADLARNVERPLEAYMLSVEEPALLADTQATCRCHFIAFDGNKQPMVKELIGWLVAQAVDYCIPRSRIKEAEAAMVRTKSTQPMVELVAEAHGLFTKLKTSGEGGEMLLYLLLELTLGLPQLLCKMPLKSDEEMHVHGADGVHGKLLPDGTLALYWGESKLYASANAAIDACLKGLAPFLKDPGGKDAKRDIYLLRDHLDLNDPNLTAALKRYFTAGTTEKAKVQVRGAALVGSSLEDYSYPLGENKSATDVAKTLVDKWRDRVTLKIDEHELAEFELEIFFVPFPDVQTFRNELRTQLGVA